jgi:hypothetical protein
LSWKEEGREAGREREEGGIEWRMERFVSPRHSHISLLLFILSLPLVLTCIILMAAVAAKTALASFMVGRKSYK